jgi:hypothetical protein
MAVGLTEPLSEMSTRNIPVGKARSARKGDSLTAICEPIVPQMLDHPRLTILWTSELNKIDKVTCSWMISLCASVFFVSLNLSLSDQF